MSLEGTHFTFLFFFNYFFFLSFFLAATSLSCGTLVGSSLTHAGSVVAARRLLSSCGVRVFLSSCEHMGSVVCGTRALSLRRVSSVVVAHGLSCPSPCGILVPQPGIKPTSPALEGWFYTTGPPGKSLTSLVLLTFNWNWAFPYITKVSNKSQWSKWNTAATIILIALGISKLIYVYH